MASSTCSHHTPSSSVSEISAGDAMTQHYIASTGVTVAAAAAVGVAPTKEESLYESLLRYHQEQTLGSEIGDDDSEERYRRAWRQQQRQYTSGLTAHNNDEELYLRQQIPRQQQQQQQHQKFHEQKQIEDDDNKIPACPLSPQDCKPSARTFQSQGERRLRSPNIPVISSHPDRSISHPRDNSNTKLLTPSKAQKPGIFHVNEPAIRSDSAMYIDAYGNDDHDDYSIRAATAQSSPMAGSSVASIASGEHVVDQTPFHGQPAQGNMCWDEHVSQSGMKNMESYGHISYLSNSNVPTSLCSPMRRGELRQTPAILKQSKREEDREATFSAPSFPNADRRPVSSAQNSVEAEEVRQSLLALQQQGKCNHEGQHRQMSGIKPPNSAIPAEASLYPTHILDTGSNYNSSRARECKTNPSSARDAIGIRSRSGVPAQFVREVQTRQLPRTLQQPPILSASQRQSGTLRSLDPMDFGSDEHIRSSRELERHWSGDLQSMQRSRRNSELRRVSPSRSVKTSMSSPNPTPWIQAGTSSRRSSGHSIQSIGSNRSGDLKMPPPAPQPSSQDLQYTNPQPSHLLPSHIHLQDSLHGRWDKDRVRPNSETVNPSHPTISSPSYHRPLESPIGSFQNEHVTTTMPGTNVNNLDLARHSRAIRWDGHHSHSDQSPLPAEFKHGERSVPHKSVSFNSEDEELRLALELSLQEANTGRNRYNASSNISHLKRPNPENISDGSAPRSAPRVSNPYLQDLTEPSSRARARHVEPTQFGQEAYRAAKHAKDSDMDDLMLALKISAEESRSAVAGPSLDPTCFSSANDPSAASVRDTVKPSEQQRILQQIWEEQERKDIEKAIEASRAEAERRASTFRISEHQTSELETNDSKNAGRDSHDATRDFLVSQQKALEEYQRNRDTKQSAASTQTDMKRPSLSDVYRENLLVQGTIETQQAISSGRAHTVKCRKCGARLQAPLSYALVYCPKCETISPA
jgi:Ubiquitin interaction motif